MTIRREPSGQRDDAPLHVVGHRLRKADAAVRADASVVGSGAAANGSPLPSARTPGHAAPLRSATQQSTVLRQVVLVDREIDALRDIAIALRDEYDFHITISGTEALNLLRAGGIDTIVVGQTLYSSTGLNVLAEARRHAPNTHRVLLANAVEAGSVERGAAAVAPFRVLQRPCTPDKLRELLDANTATALLEPVRPPQQAPVRIQPPRAPTDTHDPADFEHVVLESAPELPRRKPRAERRDDHAAAASLPIVVYTDDADFYQSIALALQDRHEVRLCTQMERAAEFAEQGQCPLLITDRAATQVELQRISIALRALDAGMLTIASGPPEAGTALRKLLGTGALHSFIPKPINAALVRLSVESAKRQYLQHKALQHTEPELKATATKSPFAARSAKPAIYIPGYRDDFAIEEDSPWHRAAPRIAVVLSLLAIAAVGGWYGWQASRTKAPTATAMDVSLELNLARAALAAGRVTAPRDDNALYYYKLALQRAPQNETANVELQQAVERAIEQAEQAMLREQLDDAANAIAAVRTAQPDNKRLPFLQSQIDKERSRQLAAHESRSAAGIAAIPTVAQERTSTIDTNAQRLQTVNRSLTTARQRMAQNRLVTPEGDSAEYFYRQAERSDPGNAAARNGLREIGVRLLDDARNAAARQQFEQARRSLVEAARFDPDTAAKDRIQREIDAAASAVARGAFLRLALQRTRDNQLFEPERDSAKFYLGQLERIDPDAAETQQAAQALALRLLDNANQAIDQQQLNAATQLINETRRLGFAGPELVAAEDRLRSARNPTVTPKANVAAAIPPKPIKVVPPKFPDEAMRAGVQGWVDVGFRITDSGDVVDVVALASSPPGRYAAQFERAAIAALRQYKFEPRGGTENTPARSMVQKVMFKLAE